MPVGGLNLNPEIKAIVVIAGKQHLVYKGLKIECEKIEGEIGTELNFNQVLSLMHANGQCEFGKPVLNKTVVGTIQKQYRSKKIIVFKKIRRHRYQRKQGHRQNITVIEITDII